MSEFLIQLPQRLQKKLAAITRLRILAANLYIDKKIKVIDMIWGNWSDEDALLAMDVTLRSDVNAPGCVPIPV